MVKIQYSKKEKDFLIHYENDYQSNAGYINDHILDKEFVAELKNRGYDVSTLKFSIKNLMVLLSEVKFKNLQYEKVD